MVGPRLVIHGGCGVGQLAAERDKACRRVLDESLEAGYKLLKAGGSAVDAVVAAILVMEESEHFNAGRGAVFTSSETHELHAGIMDGATGLAGGVTGVKRTRNPILASVKVMHETPHPFLVGDGADAFAERRGLEMVPNEFFSTDYRRDALRRILAKGMPKDLTPPQLDHDYTPDDDHSIGTVGAAALDSRGRLAGGASTGGRTAKMVGGPSDSAVAGAGFLATGRLALSTTGSGDPFIRASSCRRIADLVELAGLPFGIACKKVVHEDLKDWRAGIIGVDAEGEIVMEYNTPSMFRGSLDEFGKKTIDISFREISNSEREQDI